MQAGAILPDDARSRTRRYSRPFLMLLACALAVTALNGCFLLPRPALEFSPTILVDGKVGEPYAVTITVSQAETPVGGAAIQDGGLPDGLALALNEYHNTMQISGTPTSAGTFHFTISVWCLGTNTSGQTGTQEYTLVVT
jgi:hypothetical protein